jgi:hypothetical protein
MPARIGAASRPVPCEDRQRQRVSCESARSPAPASERSAAQATKGLVAGSRTWHAPVRGAIRELG